MKLALATGLLAAMAIAPNDAVATSCTAINFPMTSPIPAGCPLVYYQMPGYVDESIVVRRGDAVLQPDVQRVADTPQVVWVTDMDCGLQEAQKWVYQTLVIGTDFMFEEGDVIIAGNTQQATVAPAGACPELTPVAGLYCGPLRGSLCTDEPANVDADFESGGCSVAANGALALGLLPLARRRRTRAPRSDS